MKIADWLKKHVDELTKPYSDIAKAIHADTGFSCTAATVATTMKSLGMTKSTDPQSRSARDMSSWHSSAAVLAKIVRRLAGELGMQLSPFEQESLKLIIHRRKPNILPEETDEG
jgi:hypothetical protein